MMSLSHYSKTVLFAPFFASFQGAFLLLSSSLFSLPSGGEVIRGQASLVSSSDMLQVYAEGKSILHWEEFHIGSKESVHFIQSQPKEAILNRIVSGSASQILGTLKANCPIYLINPQGVYLGSSAYVETAGFLASTADLSNDDFWQGLAMQFKSFEEGSIVNLGAIYTLEGDAILLARAVDNQGSIQAPEGNVILATHEMMLYPETKKSVLIRIEEEILKEESIENSGTIEALAVELKTCSPYEKAIRHTGSIQAFSTAEQNGRIYLIAEEGGTVLNGFLLAEGGEIQVLGQTVLLEAGAVLDVSGGQGGTILIGGDYQGKNSEVKNAQFTQVEPEVHILADAWENGDGGKVIVWSDQATSYAGTISARGGAYSGDGGFVEVSGKRLQFEGKVNTDAPYGKIGTLLLDPTNITISTGADSGGSFSGCMAGTNTFTPDAAVTDTINTTTLNGLLNAPCNVTISTVGSAGGGTGAITISNDIGAAGAWSAATTLTLTAASFITVSASITNTSATTGFTALSMTANGTGATTNPGILLSAGTITTTGGDVILNGTSSTATTASHGLSISGGAIVTTAGNISVTGTVPTGATGASVFGINMNTANGVTSSTGNMAISGTSASSGAGSHGVQIAQSWTTGTSGDVIFSSCVGGTGGSNGINVGAAFSTAGNIIATSSIQGRGNAGVGFASGVNFSTTGSSKTIAITASATGTTGASHGISLTAGTLSTTGGGSITLTGTGGASNTASHGINISGTGLVSTTTGNGSIALTGTASGAAAGVGINIAGSTNSITSGSGTITLGGTSAATIAASHGVSINTNGWSPGTSALVSFSTCTGGNTGASHGVNFSSAFTGNGDVTFTSCQGGTGGGNGINVAAAFTTPGTITAISTITGRGNAGVGFASSANFAATGAGHSIAITATATGTTGACHGISITAGTLSTNAGDSITLTGTGGASNTASHGINISGTGLVSTTTGNGSIALTGTASGAAAGVGINIASSSSSITSGSGTITLGGTSTATGAASHGVSVNTSGWTPGTSALVSFSTCTGGNTGASHGVNFSSAFTGNGDVTFSSCQGGTGGGNGINLTAAFTTPGTITATSTITGRGNAGVGFASSANFAATGAGHSIAITASATGTTGSCHGISLIGGSMSTNAAGSTITLNGTAGASSSFSHGISLGGGSITTTSSDISLTGLVSVGATANNCYGIEMNTVNGITSSSGNITLSGTTNTSGLSGYGFHVGQSWTIGTTGTLMFTNCVGGTGGNTYGIVVQGAISTAGNITAINNIKSGLGSGTSVSAGFHTSSSISSSGGNIQITASCPLATAGNEAGIGVYIVSGGGLSTTGNGNITVIGTGPSISGATSYGVIILSGSLGLTTVNGTISVAGNMPGGIQSGVGVSLLAVNPLKSTTGPINVSGTSSATGASSHGVSYTNSWITSSGLGTTGTVTFGSSISDGTVMIAGCSGGTGTGSHGVNAGSSFTSSGSVVFQSCTGGNNGTTGGNGINVTGAFTTVGNITATSSITGQGNGGIGFASSANFAATGAGNSIAITATVTGTAGACRGISISAGTVSTNVDGSITLNGTGGSSGSNCQGIFMSGGGISTADGAISLTGNGGVSSNGIHMTAGTISTTGTTMGVGNITLLGTAGGNLGGYGIFLTGASAVIQTVNGLISVTGNGAGVGSSAEGIGVFTASKIQSTGTGDVTLIGTASSTGGSSSRGIVVSGGSSTVSTVSGTLSVTGTGGNGGISNSGIEVSAGGKLSTTSGPLTGTGTGGTGPSGCTGIFVTGSGSFITVATGTGINLTGVGNGTTTSNQGISLASGGGITTTSNAPITLIATGSIAGTSSNEGIFMTGASTAISTVTGDIQITATAGGGTTNGLTVDTNATVLSSQAGLVTVNSVNNNVAVQNNSSIKTQGTGGPGLNNIAINSQGLSVTAGASGSAVISTVNGNIAIPSTGAISVAGSSATNGVGQITVGNAANTVTIQMTSLTLTGSSGSGSFAEISTSGGLLSINGGGLLSLTGGSNTNTAAQILTKTTTLTTATTAIQIGAVTPPSSVTLFYGMIASNEGGNILCTTTGNYAITGGTSNVDSRAGFYTGVNTGSGNLQLTGAGFSLTGGASGSGYNSAEILAAAGGGAITITSDGSPLTLFAGGAATSDARIASLGSGSVGISNISSLALTGGSGSLLSRALIGTGQGGNITVTGSGNYSIAAGSSSSDGRAGFYTGMTSGSGDIDLTGARFSLTGGLFGSGYNSAEIMAAAGGGAITLTSDGSLMTLFAGGAATSDARIVSLGTGNITISNIAAFTAAGSLGTTLSRAMVATDQGGDITVTGSGDYTMTAGTSAGDSRAGFYTGLAAGSGDIDLTGSGFYLVGGLFGTGYSSAEIMTPATGSGSITLTSGANPISLQGGSASTSNARIIAAGSSGDIAITGTGSLSAIGGSGAASVADINAPGDLTIDLDTGSYFFTAGRGASSFARCTSAGDLDLTGTDYILTAGSSSVIDGSNAVIASTGINGSVTLLAQNGGTVALSGGTMADQHSYIQTTGATGANSINLTCGSLTINGCLGNSVDRASAEVRTVSGDIGITASGAVLLNGGVGSDANALIQSTSQGALTIGALSLNIKVFEGSEGGTSGIITQNGDISITCVQDAQCVAWTSGTTAAIQTSTSGSDLTLTAGGSINLLGFSTVSTPAPTGNLLLIAGENIFIDNPVQISASGTASSSLTLVVDNDFPASIGPGRFILNPTGSISAGLGTPVRIYTARRSQNIVSTGTDINGTAYTPGPFGVDTPTEQWGIFYSGGVYSGAAFNIYYKES